MKINERVFLLEATKARSNTFLVMGDQNILIDSGFPGELPGIVKELASLLGQKENYRIFYLPITIWTILVA